MPEGRRSLPPPHWGRRLPAPICLGPRRRLPPRRVSPPGSDRRAACPEPPRPAPGRLRPEKPRPLPESRPAAPEPRPPPRPIPARPAPRSPLHQPAPSTLRFAPARTRPPPTLRCSPQPVPTALPPPKALRIRRRTARAVQRTPPPQQSARRRLSRQSVSINISSNATATPGLSSNWPKRPPATRRQAPREP